MSKITRTITYFFLVIFLLLPPLSSFSKSPSYKKVLKKWTRSDKVFKTKDFQAAIIWNATLLNDKVFNSQANKYEEVYEKSSSEREEYYNSLIEKREGSILFFVSFYSDDRKFDDLKNPRAKWDLRLKAGGATFEPLRIEKIRKINPLQQLFYPYMTEWSTGYFVWFPQDASRYSLPYTLSVRGPFASSQLVW